MFLKIISLNYKIFLILIIWNNSSVINASINIIDDSILISKCCEKFEILQDQLCIITNNTNTDQYIPTFEHGNTNVKYTFLIGNPDCGSNQIWNVFDYEESIDKLVLLDDGKLRHYAFHSIHDRHKDNSSTVSLIDLEERETNPIYHDYTQGQYCIDKGILSNDSSKGYLFAKVCSPRTHRHWLDLEYIFRNILRPSIDILSMIIYLIIAIVYFVLPTLRDLIGNIITSISMCLIVSQAATLIKDLHLKNYTSSVIFDTIIYITLLSAFLWLNSFGYYIWKKFHSRNVFLRVTDGQKYCWYSCYVWGISLTISVLALFANHFLDVPAHEHVNGLSYEPEGIGQLGTAIFFSPIAVTILIDIFFVLNTFKVINRRNIYGRIQQKLKSNFIMFTSLFAVMTVNWIFLILSWLDYTALIGIFLFINGLQAPIIFYICILQQQHVKFLLKKTFCYNEPTVPTDWGDELTHMNDGSY